MPVTTRSKAAQQSKSIILGTLIDRSGSMEQMNPTETASAINQVIQEQSAQGDLTYFGANFDNTYNMFINGAVSPIREITKSDIEPRGTTALYSAIGRFITDVSGKVHHGEKVVIVVLTDGMNNSYPDNWNQSNIRELITEKREKDNWEFIFMGANQDAVLVGNDLGVPASSAVTYNSTPKGIQNALRSMSSAVTRTRTGEDVGFAFTQSERNDSYDPVHRSSSPINLGVPQRCNADVILDSQYF
jgi:hypothetical protein